jgi:PAS domain S-box-containing protein
MEGYSPQQPPKYQHELYLLPTRDRMQITFLEVLVVVTYAVLGIVWLIIAWEVGSTVRRLHAPLGLEQTRRRLLTAGLVVSLSLALDAGYWMIATGGRYGIFPKQSERLLSASGWNIIEKLPLVVAAAAFLWTFTMMSKLTAAEIDRRYFSRFAEQALDAITLLDPMGHVQYWNKRAEQMFGWNRDEVIGRSIKEIMVPEDRREEADEILNKVRSEKRAYSLERTDRLTSSRNTITVSINTAPIMDPDFVGYFSIIRPAAQRNSFTDHPYFHENGLPGRVPGKVFVAMPFSIHEEGFDVWEQVLVPVKEKLGLNLVRADRQLAARGVVDQVFHDIASSELVVADLTGNNPNVYYEMGLAHALGIETLLLLRINESIPFNVRHLQIIYCDPANLSKVRGDVRSAIISKRGL